MRFRRRGRSMRKRGRRRYSSRVTRRRRVRPLRAGFRLS